MNLDPSRSIPPPYATSRMRTNKKRGKPTAPKLGNGKPMTLLLESTDVSVVQNSTRPALITQLTGDSTSSKLASLGGYTSPVSQESSSLMANLACGVKVVGDMLFDPVQMKWLNVTGEEEEDVFANMDDDDDETSESGTSSKPSTSFESTGSDQLPARACLSWDQDSTIRARRIKSTEVFRKPWSNTIASNATTRPSDAISRALETGIPPLLENVDESLWRSCVEAEKRHRDQVKGFFPKGAQTQTYNSNISWDQAPTLKEIERSRPHLYYLQKVARDLRKGRNLASH